MPPKSKANMDQQQRNFQSNQNKTLTEYFSITKRGSVQHQASKNNMVLAEKQNQYYGIPVMTVKQSPYISSPSSKSSGKSRRRDTKTKEKNTPSTPFKQTPAFKQPFSAYNTEYQGIVERKVKQMQSASNQSTQESFQQNNMFFRKPSSIFGISSRGTNQKSTNYQYKPSNYTVSTDVTMQQQIQDTPTVINKRQRVRQAFERDQYNNSQFDTPFAFGEKRPARQCTLASLPPAMGDLGLKGLKSIFQTQNGAPGTSHKRFFKTPERVFLEDQRSGQIKVFKMVPDEETFPKIYKDQQFSLINMNIYQKQKECDYETDLESLQKAKEILRKDLIDALDFFVKRDPLILVSNI